MHRSKQELDETPAKLDFSLPNGGQHPEVLPGEFFFGNFTPTAFDLMPWNTIRPGVTAFNEKGEKVSGYIPVFIQASEWASWIAQNNGSTAIRESAVQLRLNDRKKRAPLFR